MTLSLWVEAGIFSVAFLLLLGLIIAGMNIDYNKNYDTSFGMSSNINQTTALYVGLEDTMQAGINNGEAQNSALGISVPSTWAIIKSAGGITWSIINGGWIENSVALMNMGVAGSILASAFRVLWILSIGFIIITILFKVRP